MNNLQIGQFIYDDSVLHRLDPRTKLICCSLIIFAVLINSKWLFLFIYIALISLAVFLAKLKIAKVFTTLRKLRYLLVLTFIFQLLLTNGQPLLQLGKLQVTKEGLNLGISTICRLVIIYLSSSLLTVSTSPVKLAAGLEALLLPLRYLKVPIPQLAMLIGTSLRFVPTFLEEADTITKAQMSRGAQFKSKKVVVRFKAQLAVIIPLLAASLQRASDLAIAMESRCYAGESGRSRLRHLKFQSSDIFVLLIVFAVFVYAVISKYNLLRC